MFTRIAPQRAQHTDGSIVQVGSRYSVQYRRGDLTAEVEADFAAVTGIYPDTLTVHRVGGGSSTLTDKERETILNRIKSGLECLGIKYEMCRRRS